MYLTVTMKYDGTFHLLHVGVGALPFPNEPAHSIHLGSTVPHQPKAEAHQAFPGCENPQKRVERANLPLFNLL